MSIDQLLDRLERALRPFANLPESNVNKGYKIVETNKEPQFHETAIWNAKTALQVLKDFRNAKSG